MDLKIIPVFAAVSLFGTAAVAAEVRMTCKNPRQEYLATFDAITKTFLVRAPGVETAYTVKKVEKGKHGTIVRGITPNNGPGFAAYFGGKKRIEFGEAGKIVQTDLCK